ncbi:MAG: hypothetical protein K1X31_00655 [Gemmatimonadaceae bacterium]|nr:hypothetical protein [Gemmatimonadaceae bacterium]
MTDSIPVAGTAARRTALVWMLYTGGLGLTLNVAPNALLPLFGLPPAQEVWVRVVGMFLLFIAWQNFAAWRSGNAELLRLSYQIRLTVPLFFGAYVALGLAPAILLMFAAVDVAAALWTRAALAREGLA